MGKKHRSIDGGVSIARFDYGRVKEPNLQLIVCSKWCNKAFCHPASMLQDI